MKKSILLFVLAFSLALTFTACSNGEGEKALELDRTQKPNDLKNMLMIAGVFTFVLAVGFGAKRFNKAKA